MTDEDIRENLQLLRGGVNALEEDLDCEDLGEFLSELRFFVSLVDWVETLAVKAYRDRGVSWADVGRSLGVTGPAAQTLRRGETLQPMTSVTILKNLPEARSLLLARFLSVRAGAADTGSKSRKFCRLPTADDLAKARRLSSVKSVSSNPIVRSRNPAERIGIRAWGRSHP